MNISTRKRVIIWGSMALTIVGIRVFPLSSGRLTAPLLGQDHRLPKPSGKFPEGRIRGYITAGPALFRHRLNLAACFGGGLTDTAETVHPPLDAIKIPIRIDGKSASSLGFDLGAGITLQVASRLRLAVEGWYFLCPKLRFDWAIPGGRFDGVFYEDQIRDVYLSAGELSYVLTHRTLSFLKLHSSQLQIRVGLKLKVG